MIKVYMPNELIAAAQQVFKAHPTDGKSYEALSDSKLRELLDRVCNCPKEKLPVLALTLSKRQNMALCRYFPQNRFHKPEDNIAAVLSLNMDGNLFEILFKEWENFPRKRSLLHLLAEHDKEEYHSERIPVKTGQFQKWETLFDYEEGYYAVIREYVVPDPKPGTLFAEQYGEKGFRSNTPLYIQCYASYLSQCSIDEYSVEGDQLISRAMNQAMLPAMSQAIMLNLLCREEKQYADLKPFSACYRTVFRCFGVPDRGKFPSEVTYRTYLWWYNYQMIVQGFLNDADQRRVQFWSQYLQHCTVTRLTRQQFLFLNFGQYYAVESEVMGTLYFYKKDYFERRVKAYLSTHTAQEGKSWMKNNSEKEYKKTHRGYWEGEVPYMMRILGMI